MKIRIKFDSFPGEIVPEHMFNLNKKCLNLFHFFPEDIRWELEDTCSGGSKRIGEDGPYTQAEAGKMEEVYSGIIHDGTFMFTITDSFGDGLCCTQRNGELTIMYGSRQFSTPFENPGSIWTLEFGMATKCPVS